MGSSLLLVGIISVVLNYSSTVTSLEQTLTGTVKLAASTITHELEGYERIAVELSYNPAILSAEGSAQLQAECGEIAQRNGVASVGVTDAEGKCLVTGSDLKDRKYFTEVKASQTTYVSDPIIRRDNEEMNIFVSASVMEGGNFRGIVYRDWRFLPV